MSWAIAAASIGSAAIGYFGSQSAANKQADAARQAGAAQQAQYQQTRLDLRPYMLQGAPALADLDYLAGVGGPGVAPPSPGFAESLGAAGMGGPTGTGFGAAVKPFTLADFQASPAYQFNLQRGEEAINKGAAARGNYYAPQTLQDLSKFSQGLASNEFQNAFSNYNTNQGNLWNRIAGLVGIGQGAANQTGAFGASAATGYGNSLMQAGNAQAAGIVGGANAINQGIGNAMQNYQYQQLLSQMGGGGGSGGMGMGFDSASMPAMQGGFSS